MREIFEKFIECVDEEFFIDVEKFDELCDSLTEETKTQLLNLLTLFENINYGYLYTVLNK